ncbi:uncharacterized protein BJ212DRAFT_1399447 [Suillus subaureus]|uniref:Uncharacterized protein n=1 Tax=Suillus subaureus TaxID=48587 RepID=A0A9P7DR80_9AGAM|nr:uncharacterized protein BJ212DRAFT_1399447 [Suillus subaureus]KAG1801160.1 hypothetical protein BJ212DRAFT_1399447 [Suillus subaureus]
MVLCCLIYSFSCECSDLHARPTLFYSLRGHRAANPITARDSTIQDIPCNFTPADCPLASCSVCNKLLVLWRILDVPTIAAWGSASMAMTMYKEHEIL